MNSGTPASTPDDALARGRAAAEAGDMAAARMAYGEALARAPSLAAITGYVGAAWRVDPAGCLKLLRAAAAPTAEGRLTLAITRLQYEELDHRRQRGLMPYHSHDIDDVLFRFASAELAAYRTAAAETGLEDQIAAAAFCAGDGAALERHSLQRFQAGDRTIWSLIRFSRDHFERLAGDDPARGLPAVTTEREAGGHGAVVWLSCSEDYLAFARPMLASLKDVAPSVAAHLHVMDPRTVPSVDGDVGVSWERAGGDRNYYHAARFIRLWQWMERHRRPVWLMDVDALFNRSPATMFARLDGADVAFRARPARIEPWNQFNASVVGFSTTPASLGYLKLIAADIAKFHKFGRLAWGVDQLAMLGAYKVLKPTVACLDAREVDYDYQADGVVWCNSSPRKFRHLKKQADPERQIYVDRFNRYAGSIGT